MNAVFKRELKAYFYSPIAYVMIGIFFAFASLIFITFCVNQSFADISPVLTYLQLILLIIFPILTMKIFSDEKKNNTEVLLLTSPVSTARIVVGKYLAALFIFLIMTASTLLFVLLFYIFGAPNTQIILGAYTAFILFGATILAINVFIASLTESQVIAAVLAFFVNIILYFFSQIKFVFGPLSDAFVSAISPIERTKDYLMGIFAINHLIFFIIMIAVMLFFTVMNIEKKRWN